MGGCGRQDPGPDLPPAQAGGQRTDGRQGRLQRRAQHTRLQEQRGSLQPAHLTGMNPEEEEPGGLRASVWPWSLWASLSRASMLPDLASRWKPLEHGVTKKHGPGLGPEAGRAGVAASHTPGRSLWLPHWYLRPAVSRAFLPSAALPDSCDPGNSAPAPGPQDRKQRVTSSSSPAGPPPHRAEPASPP